MYLKPLTVGIGAAVASVTPEVAVADTTSPSPLTVFHAPHSQAWLPAD